MKPSPELIKYLRESTGFPLDKCKKAIKDSDSLSDAELLLRKRSWAVTWKDGKPK